MLAGRCRQEGKDSRRILEECNPVVCALESEHDFEQLPYSLAGAPTRIVDLSECCTACGCDANCCGFAANSTHCALFDNCNQDGGATRRLAEDDKDVTAYMKTNLFSATFPAEPSHTCPEFNKAAQPCCGKAVGEMHIGGCAFIAFM